MEVGDDLHRSIWQCLKRISLQKRVPNRLDGVKVELVKLGVRSPIGYESPLDQHENRRPLKRHSRCGEISSVTREKRFRNAPLLNRGSTTMTRW